MLLTGQPFGEMMRCIVIAEDGYFDGESFYEENREVNWEMSEFHKKNGFSEKEAFPPALKPIDDNYFSKPKTKVSDIEIDYDKIIRDALNQLDHELDSDWTIQGYPMIKRIRELAHNDAIDRSMIAHAQPGFVRQK